MADYRRYVVVITCQPHEVDARSDLLWAADCEAIQETIGDDGTVQLKASFVDDPVGLMAAYFDDVGATAEVITDDSWMDQWRAYAKPFDVGRLTIWPDWTPGAPAADRVALRIDPRRAFGFDHPATRLCLADVDRLSRPGATVLDVGCGSGILAIAALLLDADSAVGVDIEADAIVSTNENAALNGVGDRLAASVYWPASVSADLIVANLLAPILRQLAEPITAALALDGRLVVSGLLIGQWESVANWYPDFTIESRHQLDVWESVTLRRPG